MLSHSAETASSNRPVIRRAMPKYAKVMAVALGLSRIAFWNIGIASSGRHAKSRAEAYRKIGIRCAGIEGYSAFPFGNRLVMLPFVNIEMTQHTVGNGYGIIHGKGFFRQLITFLKSVPGRLRVPDACNLSGRPR